MSITLTVDDETGGILVDKLAGDRSFLAEAPADHAAFVLFHESSTVEFLSAGYGPERVDPLEDIDLSTIRILRGVVNNTWLDNREDQLSEPLAAIIQCDLKAKTATVIYHLGDDSEAWRFNDITSENCSPPSNPESTTTCYEDMRARRTIRNGIERGDNVDHADS